MHRYLLASASASGRAAPLLRVPGRGRGRGRVAAGGASPPTSSACKPGAYYRNTHEGLASFASLSSAHRRRPRPRSFATKAAGTGNRNPGAAAGTAAATSFSAVDAATDAAGLAAQTARNNNNSNSTAVLADLLLSLPAQARDISARVPPPPPPPPPPPSHPSPSSSSAGTNGSATRGDARGARDERAEQHRAASSSLPMMMTKTMPAPPSEQSTDEAGAYPSAPEPNNQGAGTWSTIEAEEAEAEAEAEAAALSDLDRATDAAEALLVLTASPALRNAFASRHRDEKKSKRDNDNDNDNNNNNHKGKGKGKKTAHQSRGAGAGAVLDRDTVESLHFAFVSVSSWLQSSIRRAGAATAAAAAAGAAAANSTAQQQGLVDEAIVHAIELTVRSADLALPLTAPLYQGLASDVVASHASPASHPSLHIVEVANLLRVALFPAFDPPPASFFHGPCVALVRRGLVREAIELLDEMDAAFGIGEVEARTGLEMLSAVAEGMGLVKDDATTCSGKGGRESGGSRASVVLGKVGRSRTGTGRSRADGLVMELDPVDATELVFRLRGPLLRQLDDVSKQLRREMDSAAEGAEANAELVDLLESLSRPAADVDNDGDNPTGSNEDDGDNDDVPEEELLEEYLEAADDSSAADDKANALADIETLSDAVSSLAEDGSGPSPASAVGRSRRSDASVSTIYSTYQIPQSLHNQMASEMIYVRKGPSWDLPDLVEQLKRFNDGKDILYTRKYEEEMINAMMRDWEGDEDDFDDLDGYDDDGEERER